jgi:hypothetical protein
MPSRNVVDRRLNSAEFRHRTEIALPKIEELEKELHQMLSPAAFTPLRMVQSSPALRDRVLTLPVMSAIVLGLVLRGIPSQQEALRLLASEGLLWANPMKLTKQALSERFSSLPASVFAEMLSEVILKYRDKQWKQQQRFEQVLQPWQRRVTAAFAVVWTTDTSTLEALRRTTSWLQQTTNTPGDRLAGKLHAVVDTMSNMPVSIRHSLSPHSDELSGAEALFEELPEEGLAVFDEGYFQFLLFDRFTDAGKFFLTRMRQQVQYTTVEVLSEGTHYRDEIIQCGIYRSSPCKHRLRLVSVLYNGVWHRYVTNVLDEQRLSPEDISRLYRTRWRIEIAFKQIKRLLGLCYLRLSTPNGVEIQIYATWIIYTLLANLCVDVAQSLGTTLDSISYEMVYRSLYHYSQARLRGEASEIVAYLASNSKLFGIVKERRKRHRLQDQTSAIIWGYT